MCALRDYVLPRHLMLLLRRQCVIMRYLLPLSVLLLQRRARGPARQQLHARWSTQRSAKNEQMMQLQRPDAMQLKLLMHGVWQMQTLMRRCVKLRSASAQL